MSLSSGAISELQCAAKLMEMGWSVAFPFTHQNAWDLIIYKDGIIKTVQIKGAEYCEHVHTVIKADWAKYKEIDFIILHDRIHQNWFVFTKGELDGRTGMTLNPNKLTQQLNNWKRIK